MAELLRIYPENPNPKAIKKVVDVLKRGGLVIYPTDTVYGLGCDATNIKAVEKIAKIKGVKLEKSKFSFICKDLSNLSDYVKQIDSTTFKILKRSLPGAYTFILPSSKKLPHPFKKRKTIGIRVPDNSITLEIVAQLGNPLISSSIRDEDIVVEYTTDPELILEKWGNLVDIVVNGGYGSNEASTVIDLSQGSPIVVREGKGNLEIF